MRWRGWGLALAVLATLGGLAVTGRLLDLPVDPRHAIASPPPSTAMQAVTVTTLPQGTIPAALRRPLRLPSLRRDGSCPTSPAVGPPMTAAQPVAAAAVGDGPVYPVLFRATADGRLDSSAVVYWDAPTPLGARSSSVAAGWGHPGTGSASRMTSSRRAWSMCSTRCCPIRPARRVAGGDRPAWVPARAATGSRSTGPRFSIDGAQVQPGAGRRVRLVS